MTVRNVPRSDRVDRTAPRLAALRTLLVTQASAQGGRRHLSAASGLVVCGERMYVIADDEQHLGVFASRGRARGRLVRLLPGELPAATRARKRRKPDIEVLARLPPFDRHPHGALLALGSGSRPNRCTGIALPLDASGTIDAAATVLDLTAWYAPLRGRFRELNIEGGFVDGAHFALLQRGNKGDARNARVRTPLAMLLDAIAAQRPVPRAPHYDFTPFDLGSVDGVPLCFTDGAPLPGGGFAFTAVAEDADDAYADGACAGSAIGCVSANDAIEAMWLLDPPLKVEGIAVAPAQSALVVRVVTDADDASIAARLLEAKIGWRHGI